MRESSVDRFGERAENYFDSPAHRQTARLDALVARTGVSGGTVVDIGTGAGHTAYAFAKAADKVIAVDPTPEMLAIVSREGPENVETLQAFAEDLPLEDASVDGVATRLAAHHFNSVERFLAESHRVLKPGGWALVVDIVGPENADDAATADHVETIRDPSHVTCRPVSEWLRLIGEAGFAVRWAEVAPRQLELDDWLDRQECSDEVRAEVARLIVESEGSFRAHYDPLPGPPRTFNLLELTLFAVKV